MWQPPLPGDGANQFRTGVAPAEVQRLFTAHCYVNNLVDRSARVTDCDRLANVSARRDVTGEIWTKWNERESTWRKSGSCQSRGTSQSKS
jgi:hypothetical protein